MRVAIVGGGVAGVTALRALQRRGVPAALFERKASILEGLDRGLGLWPTAWRPLEADGVKGLSHAPSIPPASYRTKHGAWLSRPSRRVAQQYEVKPTTRHTLLSALLRDVDASAIHCNVQVSDFASPKHQHHHVLQAAKDGREFGPFDAVLVSGIPAQSKPAGVHALSFLVPQPLDAPAPFETLSDGRRFAAVPIDGSRCFFFATCPTSQPLCSIDDVTRLYADWHAPIPALIRAAHEHSVEGLYERPRASTLAASATDTVAHMGDAAHYMQHNLAQGATLAIEDALYAAHVLANTPSSQPAIARALEDYSRHRQARFRACYRVTRLTDVLAGMRGSWENYRNRVFLALPSALNSLCFDQFLKASFGHLFVQQSK